jgi:hypothetical protein
MKAPSLFGGRREVPRGGIGMGDGFLDRRLDDARVGEEVVDDCRQPRTDQAGQDVDRQELVPERLAVVEGGDELGPEGAGRVQRRTGDRADDHDDRDHGATDDQAGEVAR